MKPKTHTTSIGDVIKWVLLLAILTVTGSVILSGAIEANDAIGDWIVRWLIR